MLAVRCPFNPTAQKAAYPFGYYEAPTDGPRLSGPFFSHPRRDVLLGRSTLPRSAQQASGPPSFFCNGFNLCLKSADFKFKYLLNRKSELGETCAKNS
jgi:hypothetical protein